MTARATLYVWPFRTVGYLLEQGVVTHDNEVRAAVFSPSDASVITADTGGTVRVWNAVTGERRFQFVNVHLPAPHAKRGPAHSNGNGNGNGGGGEESKAGAGSGAAAGVGAGAGTGAGAGSGSSSTSEAGGQTASAAVGIEGHGLAALCLDDSGDRLVTTSETGLVRVWNYNNGKCLR